MRTFAFEELLINRFSLNLWNSDIGIRKEVKFRFQPLLESLQMHHQTNLSSVPMHQHVNI